MRTNSALFVAVILVLSACSINDDMRQFRDTVPERIVGQSWLVLEPLGAFDLLSAQLAPPDARSMAARATALRDRAAQLRGRAVLDPARARAMRAALRRFAS